MFDLGYRWEDISSCVEWMAPFAFAMRGSDNSTTRGKPFTGVTKDDQHNIQSHAVELSMLERAQQRQALIAAEAERSRHSPDPQQNIQDYPMGYLEMTPPEENISQTSVSNNSNNIRIGANTYYYESGTGSQCSNLQEDTNLDQRRDAMMTVPASPSINTNINVKVMQKAHQQSSVFLSPASDDSGSW